MKHSFRRALGVVVLAVAATSAMAHHGWSDYDDKPMTLQGRIKSSHYENPHATVVLEAQGRTWTVVLAPVSRMEARGASRESVAVGRDVTVVCYASRSHADEVRAERIVIADGTSQKTVELR